MSELLRLPVKRFGGKGEVELGIETRKKILEMLAADYPLPQIHCTLNYSKSAVTAQMRNLRNLSGCWNVGGIVAWAFRKKLIR